MKNLVIAVALVAFSGAASATQFGGFGIHGYKVSKGLSGSYSHETGVGAGVDTSSNSGVVSGSFAATRGNGLAIHKAGALAGNVGLAGAGVSGGCGECDGASAIGGSINVSGAVTGAKGLSLGRGMTAGGAGADAYGWSDASAYRYDDRAINVRGHYRVKKAGVSVGPLFD